MATADDLIADEYEPFKAEIVRTVSGKLSAAGVHATGDDLYPAYNEAWHALYMKLAAGEEIENRKGFLVTVTHRRALSEHRAHHPGKFAPEEELKNAGVEIDLDAQLDAEIQLKQITEGFRDKLNQREFEAATLCHLHGYSRPEAAQAIGVEPKRMEKIMDGASTQISAVIGRVKTGTYCQEMDSVVRAFAVGMLEPEGDRYKLAEGHLEFCGACRRQVLIARGLAAAAPPFPALITAVAGTGAAATAAGSGASSPGHAVGGDPAKAGTPQPGKSSTARNSAVGAGVVAVVAAVSVAGALALGAVGGDSGTGGGAGGGSGGGGGGAGQSASSSAGTAAGNQPGAGKNAEPGADRKKAKDRPKNDRPTETAPAEPPVAFVPVPPPPSDPVPAPEPPQPATEEPQQTRPEPTRPQPPKPDPGKPQPPGKNDQTRPITDAGAEFEIR